MNKFRVDSRLSWLILGFAMLASLALCLYVTRGTVFSADELTWVAFSPDMDLKLALEPHSGHLVLVSHLLYKFVLETIGSDYLTFRLLTLFTVFLSVFFFFIWARRRIGDWLALAPCMVLLFFGSDTGHLLQGNGFTIMLAVACGMAALVGLDWNSRKGDVFACAALCLGTITYTVALPFIFGAAVIILAREDRWKRCWVFLLPAVIYGSWRIWVQFADVDLTRGGIDPENILLLPAWIYQSLSGILSALTGLNYNFAGGGWVEPTAFAGPALALCFVLLIGWRIVKGNTGVVFWALLAVLLAMFTSQVLSWIPAVREPGTSRYLFPGAFVVLILAIEAATRYTVTRNWLIVGWLIAACGFGANVMIIRDTGAALRSTAPKTRVDITAAALINRGGFYFPGPEAVPLIDLVESPPIGLVGAAANRYGGPGYSDAEITGLPPEYRAQLDTLLTQAIDPNLVPFPKGQAPAGCQPSGKLGPAVNLTELPPGGATLASNEAATLKIWRFGDGASATVGTLRPGSPAVLALVDDGNAEPWKLISDQPFTVCDLPTP